MRKILRNRSLRESQRSYACGKRNLVDSLNTCIREHQRQALSHRSEKDSANCVFDESRREQVRLHKDLAEREKALRDTRIRNINDVEELNRAQEMRIDKFVNSYIERKSRYNTGAHFTNTRVAGRSELYE